MKYRKSKKISPKKYELTLEVSEYDMEMFEDFATTYAPFQLCEDNIGNQDCDLTPCDFTDKYRKWMLKVWRTFWMLWKKHDEY